MQSPSSWCVTVKWEFGKGVINSSRSWQIGIVVITLKFASNRERCSTHYPLNLVSSLSWNYCRTVNCLKWMKELICPLIILDSTLPGCIQGTFQSSHFSPHQIGCHSFTRFRSTLINMQIIKPHLHSLIGTHVPRIFYCLQRRGDVKRDPTKDL